MALISKLLFWLQDSTHKLILYNIQALTMEMNSEESKVAAWRHAKLGNKPYPENRIVMTVRFFDNLVYFCKQSNLFFLINVFSICKLNKVDLEWIKFSDVWWVLDTRVKVYNTGAKI